MSTVVEPGSSAPASGRQDRRGTHRPGAAALPEVGPIRPVDEPLRADGALTSPPAEGAQSVERASLDALGMQLCFSVSYMSSTGPEIVFAEILAECGLELSTRDGELLSRDVLAEVAVEFGLAVVLDGMPPAGSIIAILADLAAPFAVTVSVPAAHRLRAA